MGSRQAVIETTLRLLRRQGPSATGLNRIIRDSRSPRGSIYFHFPGGKEDLTIEALRAAQRAVVERMDEALRRHRSTAGALRRVVRAYVDDLRASAYEFGCPVANATLDVAAASPRIRGVCAEIFGDWEQRIQVGLERDGYDRREARALAEFILSSLEGALILCRARKSTAPLTRGAERILTVLAATRRPPAAPPSSRAGSHRRRRRRDP